MIDVIFTKQDALDAKKIMAALTLPIGLNIDFAGVLCILPIGEVKFPHCTWEVSWEEESGSFHK